MKRKIRGFLSIVLAVVMIINSGTAFAENEFSEDSMPMETTERAEQQNTYIFDDLDKNAPISEDEPYEAREMQVPTSFGTDITTLNENYPQVRNQNPYGTCWAFASTGLAEFDLINDGYCQSDVDFSELQLAYFTYNYVTDPLGGTVGDTSKFTVVNGGVNYLNYGGNYKMASRRLAQWIGTINESDLPYGSAQSVLDSGVDASYAYDRDCAHLQNVYVISLKNNTTDVKKQIMEHGAVGASYLHNNNTLSYNSSLGRFVYYDTDYSGGGHAVMIVGWDDDFSKDNFNGSAKPTNNGAWLIRNSWGLYVDYFWMSYESASLQDGIWIYDFEPVNNYDNNYQLDGGLDTYYTSFKTIANVYSVEERQGVAAETLEAVSISTFSQANVAYTISIYTDLQDESDPTSGTLATESTTTGVTQYAGINTITLEKPVTLMPETKFAVVVSLDKGAMDYEQAVNYEIDGSSRIDCTVSMYSGNSFYSDNSGGTFRDWPYGNFCVKAYTSNESQVSDAGQHVCADNWNDVYTIDKEATCSQKGSKSIHCKVCGAIKLGSEVEIPLAEHRWNTVMSGSLNLYRCDVCGTEKRETKKNLSNDIVTIRSAANSGYCVDVVGASRQTNANVWIWQENGCAAQDWKVTYVGDGKYTFMASCSGKYMGVVADSGTSDMNVRQLDYAETDNQRWYIEDAGNDSYFLVSAANGQYLSIDGGIVASGRNIYIADAGNSDGQRFTIGRVKYEKTVDDGVYTLSMEDNASQRVDVSGSSTDAGANVQLWTKNNMSAQEFVIKYVGDGQYTIMSSCSGKMLDVTAAGHSKGTNVRQWDDANALSQRWYIKETGSGSYYIISVCNGLCLDVAGSNLAQGTNIWMWELLGNKGQRFVINDIGSDQSLEDGVYRIAVAGNRALKLDVSGMSAGDGANVQIWNGNGYASQEFRFTYKGDGIYAISPECSQKRLDVSGAGMSAGTNICQWTDNGLPNQEWYIKDLGDGTYSIVSKSNGLYMDIPGCNLTSGNNVWCWYANGLVGQKFVFEKVTETRTIADGYYTLLSGLGDNWAVDVSAAGTNDGMNIQLWTKLGVDNQKFYVHYLGSGSYELMTFCGKRVDVSGAGREIGTNIVQWSSNGGNQQRWYIRSTGDGYYNIISVHNGLYLDVCANTAFNGNNIQLWSGNGAMCQKYKFVQQ